MLWGPEVLLQKNPDPTPQSCNLPLDPQNLVLGGCIRKYDGYADLASQID